MPSPSNIVLPPIRTLFPNEAFETLPSFSSGNLGMSPPPLKQKQQPMRPRRDLPLPIPHARYDRRVSTSSTLSSVPSLSYSPSPSPSPILSPSKSFSNHVRLVPCSLDKAEVVVVAESDISETSSTSRKRATVLTGPAVTQAIRERRKVHPYRVERL